MKKYNLLLLVAFIAQLPICAQPSSVSKKRPIIDLTQDSDSEEEVMAPAINQILRSAIQQYDNKNYLQAINNFENVINNPQASQEDLATAYYYMGNYEYYINNNIENAISHFKKALNTNKLFPVNKTYVYAQLGYLSDQSKNYADAIQYYKNALNQSNLPQKDRAFILHNLGLVYNLRKNFADAKKSFEQSLAITRRIPELKQLAGYSRFELGKLNIKNSPNIAFEHFNAALTYIENKPNIVADIFIHLGLIALKQNNLDKAISDFKEALKIKEIEPGDKSRALFNLGLAYEKKADLELAKTSYNQAASTENLSNIEKLAIQLNVDKALKRLQAKDKNANWDALIDAAIQRANEKK